MPPRKQRPILPSLDPEAPTKPQWSSKRLLVTSPKITTTKNNGRVRNLDDQAGAMVRDMVLPNLGFNGDGMNAQGELGGLARQALHGAVESILSCL